MLSIIQLYTALIISISSSGLVYGQTATNATADKGVSSIPGAGSSPASLAAGLSTGCQTAAGGLLSTEFSSCANVIGLVQIISAQGGILEPLNNWINGICSSTPCSNETLTSTASSINSGCSDDVKKGVPTAISLSNVITNYNAIRNMLCTQYTSNSTFCVPSVLGNVQTATGKNITLAQVQAIVSGGLSTSLAAVPPATYCNDCGHALFTQSKAITVNTGSANVSTASAPASDAAAQACGASFADGKVPSSIRIAGASSNGQTNAKSAGETNKASMMNVAVMGLVGLIGVCFV